MDLHEYQSKQLLSEYGLPVSHGYAVDTVKKAVAAAGQIGGDKWVVKAQIHAGGRGKAGGVRVVENKEGIELFAREWLGQKMVTNQTDAKGQPVNYILVEPYTDIDREYYFGVVIDRASHRVVVMASTEGGVDIETVATKTPEKILKTSIDPLIGPQPYQARELAFKLGFEGKLALQFTQIFLILTKLFEERDLTLLEINPLVLTSKGQLQCLDAKFNIDDNALFRQPKLKELHDPTQEGAREAHARKWDLNYVGLDGNIGCLVNGAGLAMATMDMIKLHGGRPANFLDVGGGATKERVSETFKIILSDENVKVILVNIFGGIVRCDLIAQGVIDAVEEVGVNIPVVVRLEGTNAQEGRALLASKGCMNLIPVSSLCESAQRAVHEVERVL